MKAFCAFCRSGAEHLAVKSIESNYQHITAIAPRKLIPEKRRGQWTESDRTLWPGYIFLFTEQDLPLDIHAKTNHLYKILQYEKGIRALTGSDASCAEWIYRHHGVIETSRVLAAGDQIMVIDGPLADSSGKIVRIDRHKRRAWVEFDFDGQKRVISMGAECLSQA